MSKKRKAIKFSEKMTAPYTIYHFQLSPYCRKVRMVLEEKQQHYNLVEEAYWERRPEFIAMNPAIDVPVLVDGNQHVIANQNAICEFLEDIFPSPSLLGELPLEKAETRRLVAWFDEKFYTEVGRYIAGEKLIPYLRGRGNPDSESIRAGKANIGYHLDYIGYLLRKRKWLSGDSFSLADIAAASQLSVLDYLGDVPWDAHKEARGWYTLVKSRPSFRPFLHDRVTGFSPASHYTDLDF